MIKKKILKGMLISLGISVIGLYAYSPLISSNYGFFENEFVKLWLVYITACLGWAFVGLTSILGFKIPLLPEKIFKVLFFFTFIYVLASVFGLSAKDSLIGRYGLFIHSLSTLFVLLSIFFFTFLLTVIAKRQFTVNFYAAIITSAVLTVLQKFLNKGGISLSMFVSEGRINGLFRNPNHFGFYLSLMFVFSFWLSFVKREKFWKYYSFFASLLLLLGLILTRSRASYLSVFLTLGITLIVFRKLMKKALLERTNIIFSLIFLAVTVFFLPSSSERIFGLFKDSFRSSYKIRLNEWQTVYKIWQKHPLAGIGPENLDLSYPKFREKSENLIPEEWQWRTLTTRNFWLELLATTGFFGLLGFVLFGKVIWQTGKKMRELTPFLSLFLAFYIHSFFYIPATSVKLLFFGTAGIIAGKAAAGGKTKRKLLPSLAGIGILIASFSSIFILTGIFSSEIKANKALLLISGQDENNSDPEKKLEKALALAKEAYSLNPYFDKNLRLFVLVEEEVIRRTDNEKQRKETTEKFIGHLLELEKKNTDDIENLKTLTSGYMRYAGFSGRLRGKSIEWGKRLIKTDPTGPGSFDTLGLAYLDAKDYQSAFAAFKYITEQLKPDYPYAYFHIGETYRQRGEPEKSISYYQKAIDLGFNGAKREMKEAEKEILNKLNKGEEINN